MNPSYLGKDRGAIPKTRRTLPSSHEYSPRARIKENPYFGKRRETLNKAPAKIQVDIDFFKELLDKNPLELILTLKCKNSEKQFLRPFFQGRVKRELLILILKILAKACDCSLRQNLPTFLSTIPQKEFIQEIQTFLYECEAFEEDIECIENLVKYLFHFQSMLPAMGNDMFAKIEPFLNIMVERLKRNCLNLPDNIANGLTKLQLGKESFFENMTEPQARRLTESERLQSQAPPNSFREIDILPTKEDIEYNEKPFLRPNIKEGKYADADHYLDVQFRLLREDFVRPLREGIQEYKLSLLNPKTKKYFKDIKVYTDVKVQETINTEGGLLNVIKFNVQPLKHIKWEVSKRLIHGSLVCFTKDNFETLHFATVANTKPAMLKDGFLEVQFESVSKDFVFEARFENFIMIETSAYFEAYRYVLKGLKKITELTFPFKKYIVDVEKDVKPPGYLRENSLYDMRPLLQTKTSLKDLTLDEEDNDEIVKIFFSNPSSLDSARSIPVLDLSKWPSRDECGLDEAQYCALQSALTKEFVIIQGPPGTGKTFLGLRIVKLFLQNSALWSPAQRDCPILIVCYTNHALDQFLEGILAFTDNLVRVGGRCQSEQLENYKISNLRIKHRKDHLVPLHVHENVFLLKDSLKSKEEEISRIEASNSMASTKVVPLNYLENHMKYHHYQAFNNSSDLLNWLVVNESQDEDDSNEEDGSAYLLNPPYNAGPQEGEENEEEADVENIKAMREIDLDDYKHDYYILKHKVREDEDGENKRPSKEKWINPYQKRNQKSIVKRMLKENDVMKEREENIRLENIWNLNLKDRWRLYSLWIARFKVNNNKALKKLQGEFMDLVEQLKEVRMAEDISLAQKAKVVGMTTSGAAKFRHIVEHLGSRIVVVEEAAEVLEAHVLTSLTRHTQHLVLIGDHQQLRPSPTVYQLARTFNLDVSLFERMVNNDLQCNKLVTQHRMRPCISQLLVPHIYPVLRDHASVHDYEDIKGVTKNMFFISHQEVESHFVDSQSHSNVHEASFLVDLCKYLRLQDYESSQITILTTYSSQMFTIKKMVRSHKLLEDVRVTAVDNYQGEENDIILISFVRSNDEGSIGFLKTSNRVCVALSRARKGLYCIGNFSLLAEKSQIWRQIVSQLEKNDFIADHLKLQCQLHQTIKEVKSSQDFSAVPEGGCELPCLYRLECGHTCTRACHPYDRDHQQFECKKNCQKVCKNNHVCPKLCYQDCGNCLVMTLKTIPYCGHEIYIPCYLSPEKADCTSPCPKILPCGHTCKFRCSKKECPKCTERILARALCGHDVERECSEEVSPHDLTRRCRQQCNKELSCGDICQGTCGSCFQSRIHVPCRKECKKQFICGHGCNKSCKKDCTPCNSPCQNLCYHNKCPLPCGVPCAPCVEDCSWKCPHYKCTKLCYEDCDRPPCNKSCPKILKCMHPCMGFCGEPCPKLCGICHSSELREIFFGEEDKEKARFILLEDCNHVFERSGLTKWMNATSSDGIQMKHCPKCKTLIQKNYRYGNIIKQNARTINLIKNRIFGTWDQISELKEKLQTKLASLCHSHTYDEFGHFDKMLEDFDKMRQDPFKSAKISMAKLFLCINLVNCSADIFDLMGEPGYLYLEQAEDLEHLRTFTRDSLDMVLTKLWLMLSNKGSCHLAEIEQEIIRLDLIIRSCTLRDKMKGNNAAAPYFTELLDLLQQASVFTEKLHKETLEILSKVSKLDNNLALCIEKKERIYYAPNFIQGHWFKCPKGHVYFTVERALEVPVCSSCPET